MKCLALILALAVSASATQWGNRTLAPGLNTSGDDYAQSILSNGTIYKVRDSYGLYRHTYAGSYSWNAGVQCNTPSNVATITIDPSGNPAIVCASGSAYDIRWASSSDGINWTWGNIISGWNRNPHYPTSVSCAWRATNKPLYVAYEDGKIFWANYPYDNPQEITSLGFVPGVAVRFTGDYIVVDNNTDLFESFGSGGTWSTRQPITEVNTSREDIWPTLGAIEGRNILLWSAPGTVGGYDIYYSKGSSNSEISSTSLGRIKAMFQ